MKVDSEDELKFSANLQVVLNAVLEMNSKGEESQRKMEAELLRGRESLRGESLKEELIEDGADSSKLMRLPSVLPSSDPPACAAEGGA